MLLSVQFKTTKKRVLNWKKKFSQTEAELMLFHVDWCPKN